MSIKQTLIDFINYVFILAIIAFFILYFIVGDRFAIFAAFVRNISPLAVFILMLLIRIKISRSEFIRRKYQDNKDLILYLSYIDKFINDFITFSSPVIILFIPLIFYKTTDLVDIIQAILTFLLIYLWQRHLFNKAR